MQQEHSCSRWICTSTSHKDNLPFDSAEEFEKHMDDHPDTFEDFQLPIITESSLVRLSWTETLTKCPLCDESPENDDVNVLRYHIADHLRLLAMIPYLGLNEEESKVIKSSASIFTFSTGGKGEGKFPASDFRFGLIRDVAAMGDFVYTVYNSCETCV